MKIRNYLSILLLISFTLSAEEVFPTLSYRTVAGCDPTKTLNSSTSSYDEGQCHSSWALSVAAALSDSHCRFHIKDGRNKLAKKQFSAQHLLECCHECRYIAKEACSGGNINTAILWIKDNGISVASEERGETQPASTKKGEVETQYSKCFWAYKPVVCPFSKTTECKLYSKIPPKCPTKCTNPANTTKDIKDSSIGKSGKTTVVESSQSIRFRRFGNASPDFFVKKTNLAQILKVESKVFNDSTKKLSAALITSYFNIAEAKSVISNMELFTDIFEYTLGAGVQGLPYIHRRGQSIGYYPARLIGHLNNITVDNKVVYSGRVWEIILPFKEIGDKGRIYIPAGINHCGIEAKFMFFTFEKDSKMSSVVEKVK